MSNNERVSVRETVFARGDFSCPVEQASVAYVLKHIENVADDGSPRSADTGEFVECRSCGTVFPPTVLGGDESTQASSLHGAFSLLFSAMIIADGKVKPAELDAANRLSARLGLSYDTDTLTNDTPRVRGDLSDVLREASRNLSLELRRELLIGAIVIARADGEIASEERGLIANAGRHMGFTRSSVEGIFADAT